MWAKLKLQKASERWQPDTEVGANVALGIASGDSSLTRWEAGKRWSPVHHSSEYWPEVPISVNWLFICKPNLFVILNVCPEAGCILLLKF